VIVHAAPILRWCVKWPLHSFEAYCLKKKWSITYVNAVLGTAPDG
jgi:hypothetical protein